MSSTDPVKVAVRFRPLNDREHRIDAEQRPEALSKGFIIGNQTTVVAYYDLEKLYFSFDHIFSEDASQEEVYNYAVAPAVDDVLMGYNGTILAYGQTGAGKSYTMQGPPKRLRDPILQGAIPRVCAQIFGEARNREEEGATVTIKCSFLQIYQEGLFDMMHAENSLKLRETPNLGVWVDNLTQAEVHSEAELMRYVVAADKSRSVAHTDMSERSSRSHSLVTLVIEQAFKDGMVITGKLVMVDLAGSEKVHKSRAHGGALVEARGINKSLSALGNCIQALTKTGRGHVPYRDSKLTHLLKESLGGETKTSLLVACSPHWSNYEETISSLRFATRAKELKIVAKVNQTTTEAALQVNEEECLEDGLSSLQKSLSGLLKTCSSLRPGERLGAHKMNEIQHLTTWCNERAAHLAKKSKEESAEADESRLAMRKRMQTAELQVASDGKRHLAVVQAHQQAEQRSDDMSNQVGVLETECYQLRDQIEKLKEQNERQRHMLEDSAQRVDRVTSGDNTKEALRWKAKYEALKSRLPQMFDLVMDSEELESRGSKEVSHSSPTKPGAAHLPAQSPADLEFGLVELQLKYEESRSNLSMANAVLAQREAASPGSSWHHASLSLSPSLSQSVSQSPVKASPLTPRTNVHTHQQNQIRRGHQQAEKSLRNAISNTCL